MGSGNPHGATFPVRPHCNARWFVDGKDAFRAIFEAINAASETVYITDWFLSPEILLIRDNLTEEEKSKNQPSLTHSLTHSLTNKQQQTTTLTNHIRVQ